MADAATHLQRARSLPPNWSAMPLVANNRSIGWISDAIAGVAEGKTPLWWWACFIPSVLACACCGFC